MKTTSDTMAPATNLKSYVTFLLSRTQNKLSAQASHILKTHSDLSVVEWRIIEVLRHFDGGSLSMLANELQMDKGQLSRKVSQMIAKKLILSMPDKMDHRRQHLHLTQAAVEVRRRLGPIMERRRKMLVEGMEPEQLRVFFDVLAKIDAAAQRRDIT